ncbi:hypothetical protein EW146_g8498 [Bondarzewia mesenterica]|uniref:Uncharacterized protein n=1 Tax=Bondarzewia mesenterica TaxID=1095465 RepID=A0A4S4LDU5_9AGAM|nr:hypothetical protein EW146_g8498 [Bondarzewia mesenterica]
MSHHSSIELPHLALASDTAAAPVLPSSASSEETHQTNVSTSLSTSATTGGQSAVRIFPPAPTPTPVHVRLDTCAAATGDGDTWSMICEPIRPIAIGMSVQLYAGRETAEQLEIKGVIITIRALTEASIVFTLGGGSAWGTHLVVPKGWATVHWIVAALHFLSTPFLHDTLPILPLSCLHNDSSSAHYPNHCSHLRRALRIWPSGEGAGPSFDQQGAGAA